MKCYVILVLFFLGAGFSNALAQSEADDQYVFIYSALQQADTLAGSGRPQQALKQYTDVQGDLLKFQKAFPAWYPKIMAFRLSYVAGKIAELAPQLPVPSPAPVMVSRSVAPGTSPSPAPASLPAPASVEDVRGQLADLEEVNRSLQAKLREALAAQPAAIDARELAKAQGKIQGLMKENELLKVGLSQGKTRTNVVLVPAQTEALQRSQQALIEANRKLSEQVERADRLALENRTLQGRLESLLSSSRALDALREENTLLKKQVATLSLGVTHSAAPTVQAEEDLKQARLQIASLQSDLQVRRLETAALENQLRKLSAAPEPAPEPAPAIDSLALEARIRELTRERNELIAKLGSANQELRSARKQSAAAQIADLNDQLKSLRARLAVEEAQAVPYTPEELALFRQAAPQPAGLEAAKKSIKELPSGSAELVAEAQKFFAAKKYAQAEDNYQKILQRDENNSIVLGNLATIEMEQGKLAEAEKHLTAAVAQNPEDAYNVAMLGYLRFRQEKYDEALTALSQAAKLDPRNPEIQNYLGVTLSHQGLRVPAETALRRAVQLAPEYAAAHNNLAVIYARQQPPLLQLARWHYQKARAAGQPPNPDLETILNGNGAPSVSK
jgi:tetratricopeptide (TPR) repeat protein